MSAAVPDADPNARLYELAADARAANDPTGWFERLYVAAEQGEAVVPWDRTHPGALLAEWVAAHDIRGEGRRALVVGCALGRDSEFIASLGFDTVAFDISETAVRTARERHVGSSVSYVVADLFDPPPDWRAAFDLVVESLNVQSLPEGVRSAAIANVGAMVASGGTLIVVSVASNGTDPDRPGPPWPLARAEIDAFAVGDLEVVQVEDIADVSDPAVRRWRAEFRRPAA